MDSTERPKTENRPARVFATTQWSVVLARLREEYAQRDRAALFDALKPSLVGSRDAQPYDRLFAQYVE